jgi:hypothetical protein
VGKPEGKGAPGRPYYRYQYNIKMNVRENGLEVVDWVNLDQDRVKRCVVNTVMKFRVPYNEGNFLTK